jgi:hypothetical protein
MKKIIAWPLAWSLYWAGDIISKPLNYFNWWWLYPVYNNLMCASFVVQDWAKLNGPWESTKK